MPSVADGEDHVLTRFDVAVFTPQIVVLELRIAALNGDLSPIRHGVFRIHHQIHDHLLDLPRIRPRAP